MLLTSLYLRSHATHHSLRHRTAHADHRLFSQQRNAGPPRAHREYLDSASQARVLLSNSAQRRTGSQENSWMDFRVDIILHQYSTTTEHLQRLPGNGNKVESRQRRPRSYCNPDPKLPASSFKGSARSARGAD